jgi:hypothetical protein
MTLHYTLNFKPIYQLLFRYTVRYCHAIANASTLAANLKFLEGKFQLHYPANYIMRQDAEFRHTCPSDNLVTFEDFFPSKLS